ncbi:MAG: nucleotidyl transferase AbiEii/AbiGii toxin family protein [Desulfovibrionales bacterium]|nr:nucleotidyl transferase AbiEii/AbiGii toxin family protein [Desulfovibrionales bacterium]
MFFRPHHKIIANILTKLNPELLRQEQCYFAGGTAIALRFGEFRESVDLDFMTSDKICYRNLRQQIREHDSLSPLVHKGEVLELAADIRADQYGIRTKIISEDCIIKFEIVLEGRIHLDMPTKDDNILGISSLTLVDLAASKILANSDRGLDTATHTRDIIDLAMMEQPRSILNQALKKAETAYGASALRDLEKVFLMLENNPSLLEKNMAKMAMDVPQAIVWQKLKKLKKLTLGNII